MERSYAVAEVTRLRPLRGERGGGVVPSEVFHAVLAAVEVVCGYQVLLEDSRVRIGKVCCLRSRHDDCAHLCCLHEDVGCREEQRQAGEDRECTHAALVL